VWGFSFKGVIINVGNGIVAFFSNNEKYRVIAVGGY
jgi:hypothetical protein